MKQEGPRNICMCSVNICWDKRCSVTETVWKILPQGNEMILEKAVDLTMWRIRFGRGYGTVAGQTAK